MTRPLHYGDVVEWDTPADEPDKKIRWFIVSGRPGDYMGVWLGGGATQHWNNMANSLKNLGVQSDNRSDNSTVISDED
jgi:hypothetical protein